MCYDVSKHKLLKSFEDSREPVVLKNVTQKRSLRNPSKDDVIINKRSRVEAANNNDISFEYAEAPPAPPENFTTMDDIMSLVENQLTSVKGILACQTDSVQQVPMKDGFVLPMLDCCTISDDTGTRRLTLWGTAIDEVVNHTCYSITDVRVKVFNSMKYLTTTPATTFTVIQEMYEPLSQSDFSALFDAVTTFAPKVLLADSYNTWLSCVKCAKQVTNVTSSTETLIKCSNCSSVQPLSSCNLKGSVRIQVQGDDDDQPTWLKVFTAPLQKMLQQASSPVTLDSPEEEVYTQLFLLKNFFVDFNKKSLIVEDVRFSPS